MLDENTFEKLRKILDLDDWETLAKTANQILSNASRDLVLWSSVLKDIKKEMKKFEKEKPKENAKQELSKGSK